MAGRALDFPSAAWLRPAFVALASGRVDRPALLADARALHEAHGSTDPLLEPLLACLAGTPFAASLAGAILVIEEVGEAPYRVDRLLTQLSMQADIAACAGFAFGEFEATEAERPLIERALRRFAEEQGRPAVLGFPAGHGTVNYPVPEGVTALLDADAGRLAVVEDPYEDGW